MPYVVGEHADWTDKKEDFVPCIITAVNGEDSYEVKLDDGRKKSDVSASNLRRVPHAKPSRSMAKGEIIIEVGVRVRAQFPGDPGGEYYPGTIYEVHPHDRMSIVYDDGDFSDMVYKYMIH